MTGMEIEGHIFPADIEHARGTRCERCGVIFQGRKLMTCTEVRAYLAENGVRTEPTVSEEDQ